ncbi:MAG: heme exporter protein CcmD [Hyphomicrobiales bacterium]|nr:heme exporter protein CcmD [Hyphomicrobiales bacterium]MDE2115767.1 heme exporter protein CcmD [Hyphomicrobiales bacterium]
MNDPRHIMFIVAAYGVAAMVIAAMIMKLRMDHSTLKRALLRVESRRPNRANGEKRN